MENAEEATEGEEGNHAKCCIHCQRDLKSQGTGSGPVALSRSCRQTMMTQAPA